MAGQTLYSLMPILTYYRKEQEEFNADFVRVENFQASILSDCDVQHQPHESKGQAAILPGFGDLIRLNHGDQSLR